MLTVIMLALTLTSIDDPVSGSPLYTPKIGESAVIHDYDPELDGVSPEVDAWTNTTALAKFIEAASSESYRRERIKVLGDSKALAELNGRIRDELAKVPIARKELESLSDMTPVRVRVLAKFMDFGEKYREVLIPDYALVEVTSGPSMGRFFWVSRFSIRVPGAKSPDFPLGNFDDIAPDVRFDGEEAKPKTAPAPRQPAPPLRVEATSWDRLLQAVRVHCRVRNTTDHPIGDVMMKVIYEDASGNLVSSSDVIVGDLKPGELKTVSSFDLHDTRMHHYDFEFSSRENGGERSGIGFSRR